jgi:DNA-binding response OmpR family regulator
MHDHSQILVISRDQMLLQTRRLILGTYFEVEAAGRMSEAGMILSKRDFDVIVLCDTLSESDCQQIAEMVHDQRPQPTLFSLQGPGKRRCSLKGTKTVDGAPLELLKECADVLGCNLRGKHKMFSKSQPQSMRALIPQQFS